MPLINNRSPHLTLFSSNHPISTLFNFFLHIRKDFTFNLVWQAPSMNYATLLPGYNSYHPAPPAPAPYLSTDLEPYNPPLPLNGSPATCLWYKMLALLSPSKYRISKFSKIIIHNFPSFNCTPNISHFSFIATE